MNKDARLVEAGIRHREAVAAVAGGGPARRRRIGGRGAEGARADEAVDGCRREAIEDGTRRDGEAAANAGRRGLELERQVSDLVNAAYGLTPAEIELMWATAPPRMPLARPVK